MPRHKLGVDVFQIAIDRMAELYEEDNTIVVSFSAGKDSTCILEICLIAARLTGKLPVYVMMRDEEIAFPGTTEYALRVAARDEIEFHWIIANQPVVNAYNRTEPYFWVFDKLLDPEDWVRQPPDFAEYITDLSIDTITIPERFPVKEGKTLFAVIGLRVQESRNRKLGLFSSGGYLTKASAYGVRNARPIYDWTDGDVWKAIFDNGWDYNKAYDTMVRLGVKRKALRIAPPTLNPAGVFLLQMSAKAWPQWFDKVAKRCPGVRLAAKYGRRAVRPVKRLSETWEQCFNRTCIDEAPQWVAERATAIKEKLLRTHGNHSTTPFPEIHNCDRCTGWGRSWKKMAIGIYFGDPFSARFTFMPYVEPEYFRDGAGKWHGKPNW